MRARRRDDAADPSSATRARADGNGMPQAVGSAESLVRAYAAERGFLVVLAECAEERVYPDAEFECGAFTAGDYKSGREGGGGYDLYLFGV